MVVMCNMIGMYELGKLCGRNGGCSEFRKAAFGISCSKTIGGGVMEGVCGERSFGDGGIEG